MAPIIILDLVLLATVFVFSIRFVWLQISNDTWLKAHGTHIGALITYVRRDSVQTCLITAAWTDPRTGRRFTFRGFRLNTGYQVGQLVEIVLDVHHPSRYAM